MKFSNSTRRILPQVLCSLGIAALQSCGLTEPSDSALKENTPPDTRITSGPKASSTYSYSVRIAWVGVDNDGIIKGYNLTVDGNSIFVTGTDSTFAFNAANQDEQHSISVAAVDDRDAVDPTPATLTFTATNSPPNTILSIAGNPAPGATFGRGAIFTMQGEDIDNGLAFSYRYNLDGGAWSDWLSSGVIAFSQDSPFGLLPEGQHIFNAQVRDAALAVDETPTSFPLVVSAAVKPEVVLNAQQNNRPFFEDNSAFSYASGNTVQLSWSPLFNYAGGASTGSRYRIDGGAWTDYSTVVSTLELTDVAPGSHTFEVQYRDLGGVEGDISNFEYEIVVPAFNSGVLVVDDGNGQFAGRPPATGDANVKAFYNQILTAVGAPYQIWDILTQGNPTPKTGMGEFSTVLWVSDEANLTTLPRQVQLITEYLSLSGNFWLVGWRGINLLAGTTPVPSFDPAQPTPPTNADFIWNFLKIASTEQTSGAALDFSGAAGLSGHPNLNLVVARNPIPNRPGLSPIDAFTVRANVVGAEPIYTFVSPNGTSSFQGKVVGMKYLGNDFKVAVFGFPFYHMSDTEAIEAARKLLRDFGEIQ
ncbi:MAG: hypothetical protein ACREOO_26390 [bacterium]